MFLCPSFLMLGMVTFLGGGMQMMFLGQALSVGSSWTWGVVRRVWGQHTPRPPPTRRHWEDWRRETSCRNLTHFIRDRHSPATPFLANANSSQGSGRALSGKSSNQLGYIMTKLSSWSYKYFCWRLGAWCMQIKKKKHWALVCGSLDCYHLSIPLKFYDPRRSISEGMKDPHYQLIDVSAGGFI